MAAVAPCHVTPSAPESVKWVRRRPLSTASRHCQSGGLGARMAPLRLSSNDDDFVSTIIVSVGLFLIVALSSFLACACCKRRRRASADLNSAPGYPPTNEENGIQKSTEEEIQTIDGRTPEESTANINNDEIESRSANMIRGEDGKLVIAGDQQQQLPNEREIDQSGEEASSERAVLSATLEPETASRWSKTEEKNATTKKASVGKFDGRRSTISTTRGGASAGGSKKNQLIERLSMLALLAKPNAIPLPVAKSLRKMPTIYYADDDPTIRMISPAGSPHRRHHKRRSPGPRPLMPPVVFNHLRVEDGGPIEAYSWSVHTKTDSATVSQNKSVESSRTLAMIKNEGKLPPPRAVHFVNRYEPDRLL